MRYLIRILVFLGFLALATAPAYAGPGGHGNGKHGKGPPADKKPHEQSKIEGKGWIPPGLSPEERGQWVNGRPPGWQHGEKTGWGSGNMPPGLRKKGGLPPGLAKKNPPHSGVWSERKQKDWENEVDQMKRRLRDRARAAGVPRDAADAAEFSFEAATSSGVPVQAAGSVVDRALEKRLGADTIEKVTRALAYGVGRNADFNAVSGLAASQIDDGVKGDDLAIAIYKAIARARD